MSFGITFVQRPVGDDWAAAMDALEATSEEAGDLSPADLDKWQQIRAAVADDLPDAEESGGATHRELSDELTGMQLSIFPTEVSLSVPYWSDGPDAERIVGMLRRVAEHVERITGLVGYDPQSDCAFLEGQPRQAVDTFDRVSVVLDEYVAEPAAAASAPVASAATRRWWRFGRN